MVNVSVIVPIYNAEKHLVECLDSLKAQSLDNIEFILVDDGSTDSSKQICKKYLKDERFKYIYQKNNGHVSAYLNGFKFAKGQYIGFVDADDYIDKNMYKKMYEIAIKYNDDIVIAGKNDIDDNGKAINASNSNQYDYDKNFDGKNIFDIYNLTFPPFNGYHLPNSRWNKLFKKDIFSKNIKYLSSNPRTFEDRFITPACIFSSKSIYVMNDKLYYYRHSPNTVHVRPKRDLYEILKTLSVVQKEMLIENNLYEIYKNKYEIAQLNYLSIFVDRNIICNSKFKDKIFHSTQIIKDKDYRNLIKKHKKELNGKKGLLLKISYFFKSSFLLSMFSYLGKK